MEARVITSEVHRDHRGYFEEIWKEQDLPVKFVQDNHSRSFRGVLRGLHYQVFRRQAKLVKVIRGEIFDVAVDLRKDSLGYGTWVGEVLSEYNHKQMFVPEGFAHGFLTLSDVADVIYKCSDIRWPEFERTICWDDPDIGIDWPFRDVILSDKDASAKLLKELE